MPNSRNARVSAGGSPRSRRSNLVVILTPSLANYFGLLRSGALERAVMLVAVPLWFLSLRTAWRARLFERFLYVDDLE